MRQLTKKEIKLLCKKSGLKESNVIRISQKFYENCPFGSLNKAEFINLYSSLRYEAEEQIRQISSLIFNAFDVDKNGLISLQEFLVYIFLMVNLKWFTNKIRVSFYEFTFIFR